MRQEGVRSFRLQYRCELGTENGMGRSRCEDFRQEHLKKKVEGLQSSSAGQVEPSQHSPSKIRPLTAESNVPRQLQLHTARSFGSFPALTYSANH